MSEFSDSYHLRSGDVQGGADLLRRAGLAGFAFPPTNGWVTLLVDCEPFAPSRALVTAAGEATLLHYACAEDHGWSCEVFRGGRCLSLYRAEWDEEVHCDASRCQIPVLQDLAEAATGRRPTAEEFAAILEPADVMSLFGDDLQDRPSYHFARLMGLVHYEWLDYESFAANHEPGADEFAGVVEVA